MYIFFKKILKSYLYIFPILIFVLLLILTAGFYQCYPWVDVVSGSIFIASLLILRKNLLWKSWYYILQIFFFITIFLTGIIYAYYWKFSRSYAIGDLAIICGGNFYETWDFFRDPVLYPFFAFFAIIAAVFLAHEYIYIYIYIFKQVRNTK